MGAWAHDEKNEYSDLDSLAFDPSILLIVVGCLMFVVTFCGCVGALRENKILLHIVSENYIATVCHAFLTWGGTPIEKGWGCSSQTFVKNP